MDRFLVWLGGFSLMMVCLMAVPAAYVVFPWLMGVVGMMPTEVAARPWEQAEPWNLPFLLIWALFGVLALVGRSARDRLDRAPRKRR